MDTVIVALPREDDRVNRIASGTPHLTLMYLGEEFDMDNLESVVRYLKHIAETSLYRFGLSVDRRGTLGDKNADVLFFEDGWQTENLKDVIGYLLADDHLSVAYNQQRKKFPKWVPHLTLGYPDKPAKKPQGDDDGRIWYVDFDRIAIWTGDSEGPEFLLKKHSYSDELAMAEDAIGLGSSFAEYFMSEPILEHYGIKGMRWGHRRAEGPDGTVGGGSAPKKERGKIRRAITKANVANKAANEVINKGHNKLIFLPQAKRDQVAAETKSAALQTASLVNKRPQYKGKDVKRDPDLKAAYQKDIEKALRETYAEALTKARVEASLDAVSAVMDARRQRIDMQARQSSVQHADGGMAEAKLTLSYEVDELGQIKSFDVVEDEAKHAETMDDLFTFIVHGDESEELKIVVSDELLHSAEFVDFVSDDDFEEVLAHYGVKGMRWGIRKSDRVPTGVALTTKPGRKVKAKGGRFEEPSEDAKRTAIQKQKAKSSSTDSLSNQELKQMIERMQLEANYKRLAQQESGAELIKKLFLDPKYRNRQVESISEISMPVRKGAGMGIAGATIGRSIRKTDLSKIGR